MRRRVASGALLVFAFVLPWEDSLVLPGLGTIGRLAGLLLVACTLPTVVTREGLRLRPLPLFLAPMIAYGCWAAASTLWSVDQRASLGYASTFAQLTVMTWVVWQLCSGANLHRVLAAYLLGCLVSIGSAVANYLTGNEAAYQRFAASGSDPNEFALLLALGIPMAWQLLARARRAGLLLPLAFLPAAIAGVVLSASRGGALASLVALTVVPLAPRALGPTGRRGLVAAAALLLAATPFLAPHLASGARSGVDRLATIGASIAGGTLNQREVIWAGGLAAAAERPALGAGAGAFASVLERSAGLRQVAHNTFVSVLVETGAVGLALFLATLLAVALPLLRLEPGRRATSLVLLATLLVGLLPLSWDLRKPTWFVLTLLAVQRPVTLHGPASATHHRPVARVAGTGPRPWGEGGPPG